MMNSRSRQKAWEAKIGFCLRLFDFNVIFVPSAKDKIWADTLQFLAPPSI